MELSLSKLGIKNGTQFDCDDFVQHLQFKLIAFHSPDLEAEQFEVVSSAADFALVCEEQKTNGTASLNSTQESLENKINECAVDEIGEEENYNNGNEMNTSFGN